MSEEYLTLWTFQTPELFRKINEEGVGYCDFLSEFAKETPEIERAYEWMCDQMRKRIASPENDNAKYPLWAWRYFDGSKNPKPRKCLKNMDSNKESQVFMELRIPKSRVLLSDFMFWNLPLLGGPVEEDCVEQSANEIWEKIFDENFMDPYWVNGKWEDRAIQATLWCIFPDDIVYADLLTKQSGRKALKVKRIYSKRGRK